MSTTTMWVLFGTILLVIVAGSIYYKKTFSVREIASIGIMAALSFIAYEFFRIPLGTSSFHLGNTFVALTALLLDGVCGGLAGAIGLSLADIFAGDPGYAVTTFILKFIIGITCGFVAHKVFKLKEIDPKKDKKAYLLKVAAAAASGLFLNVITDPVIGYFRNVYIFGNPYTAAQVIAKIAGGVTFVNSVLSTICAFILYINIRPALTKAGLLKDSVSESQTESDAAVND